MKRNLGDAFPNVEVLLRPSMTVMIGNCSGDGSFYKLKLVKDEHRSTTSQNILDLFIMLNTEWDIMRSVT